MQNQGLTNTQRSQTKQFVKQDFLEGTEEVTPSNSIGMIVKKDVSLSDTADQAGTKTDLTRYQSARNLVQLWKM